MSGLVQKIADEDRGQGTHRVSTEDERHRAEAALISRWREGVFASPRDARYASIEGAQQHALASDLEEASEEVRALAFPPPEEAQEPPTYVDAGPVGFPGELDLDDEIVFDDEFADMEPGWGLT
ncbi:hypothetical protein [Ornithinimicrobium sp. INDO-MA30-4]|uniref:hypothetical protein n=1 Tax=Ornithinimicrobium sp. INDO-MA30-4 TaxID=2908651 RepID=UPI001F3A255A|nr:hypothetical protein [Ornithinimicrobium sp. INDO-MA30-4]UJH70067.1 hypothetical protein L0A91_12800 [Ornithinimicrobium sp. INDO-MA30-4]